MKPNGDHPEAPESKPGSKPKSPEVKSLSPMRRTI